jgi:formylglycine-generating enzyme required for sulfatase activity
VAEAERQRIAAAVPPKPSGGRAAKPAVGTFPKDYEAGDVFKDCDACPEMVAVPSGRFTMGSPPEENGRYKHESPQHRVTISKPFAVGRFEVTFDEWDACVAGGGCSGYRPKDRGWGRGRRPVILVNRKDAKAYVDWLSRRTGESYRLLTESEWEYVARAGSTTRQFWGEDVGDIEICGYANGADRITDIDWRNKSCTDGVGKRTAPVGKYRPNAFGLYDVIGNVWEWVEDCWNRSYAGAPGDGGAWLTSGCSHRVVRGGSWINSLRMLRAAVRYRYPSHDRDFILGFRVARKL